MQKDINSIPHAPGVYLMRDKTGAVIYVGKAVDLRKRVGSYFQKKVLPPRIASLISNIQNFDYLVAENEHEALVLENKLIKKFQPRYNTLLRDDKTYPYLVLTLKENYPRLFLARKKKNDGSLYYGPYPFVSQIRGLISWLVRNFSLRPCREKLGGKPSNAQKKKYNSCLYMHIEKCPAPCLGGITQSEYDKKVKKLRFFLEGRHSSLISIWKREMKKASGSMNFELASQLRDRIYALENMYKRIRFKKVAEEELVYTFKATQGLSELKKVLDMEKVPLLIEAFDISNIAGKYSAGSMVSFKNGLPDKSNYRIFKIKTVPGINDPGMIGEIVKRRYARVLREENKMPDLILIDGGKTQLNSAGCSLAELGIKDVMLVSLAKGNEEIYRYGEKGPLILPKDNIGLHLLMRVRDESHRFAVSFYRKTHRKEINMTTS